MYGQMMKYVVGVLAGAVLIAACGAIPCAAWLDGTLPGEQAIEELLELLIGKGGDHLLER